MRKLRNQSSNWRKTKVSFKACPRCSAGDIIRERDTFGWYEMCLQCGFMKDLKGPDDVGIGLTEGATDREREPVSA